MRVLLLLLFLILPVSAGVIGRRRFGRIANFLLMMFVFQVGLTTFVFFRAPARFQLIQLALLIPGVGILPGIGRLSGISPGGLVYPLIFALLSIVLNINKGRTFASNQATEIGSVVTETLLSGLIDFSFR